MLLDYRNLKQPFSLGTIVLSAVTLIVSTTFQYFGQNLSRFQTSNPDSAVGLIFFSKSEVELTLKK